MKQNHQASNPIQNLNSDKHLLIHGSGYTTQKDTRQKIRMQILSNPKFLKPFRNFVYDISLAYGISSSIAFELKLICSEAISNIIKHAYLNYHSGWIFFEYLFYTTYVELRFRDFSTRKISKKNLVPKDLTDFRESGIGLYLISRLCDYHYFEQMENSGTLLVMKKRIHQS